VVRGAHATLDPIALRVLRAPPAALPAVSPAGEVQIALAFLGAVAGFLVFNLRRPGRRHALAFPGSAAGGNLTRCSIFVVTK